MQHSELYVETRPVADELIRVEAYRIWYEIQRTFKEPGEILLYTQEEWQQIVTPKCDPNKLHRDVDYVMLRQFLYAMPELVRNGGISINWSKKPNGAMKYQTDEWGTVVRLHNPKVDTHDPSVVRKYRSPIRQIEDEPMEDIDAEYYAEYDMSVMSGRMTEKEVKQRLKSEAQYYKETKQFRHATELPVRSATVAERSDPQDIHKRYTPKRVPQWESGIVVQPVTMIPVGGGRFVESEDYGEVIVSARGASLVRFVSHNYTDLDTFELMVGHSVTAWVTSDLIVAV